MCFSTGTHLDASARVMSALLISMFIKLLEKVKVHRRPYLLATNAANIQVQASLNQELSAEV